MHITENEILLFLEGKLSAEKRTGIEKHLSGCSECTSKLAGVYSFTKEIESSRDPELENKYFAKARSFGVKGNGKKLSLNKVPMPSLVFALSVVIVAVVAAFFYLFSPVKNTEQLEYRGNIPLEYSLRLSPADGSVLESNYLNFSWNKVNNALEYKMTVFDLNGDMIFNKSISDTIINLNSRIYFKFGETYLWNIVAYLPDGRFIKSAVNSFEFSTK
jgi:hypothetical protein